jgi:hypothetical protein
MKLQIKVLSHNGETEPKEVEATTLSQALAILEEDKTCELIISDGDSTGEIMLSYYNTLQLEAYNL